MKRLRGWFNPKDLGTGPTGSDDDDTSFTLTVETFSFKELSAATNNFSWTCEIGSGGQSTVYEGINAKLQDGKFEELLDPMLRGSVSKKVLTKAPIAYKCTMKEDVDRPKIQNVIDDLDRVISVSLSCDDTPCASSSAAR